MTEGKKTEAEKIPEKKDESPMGIAPDRKLNVYECINKIQAELAKDGIQKEKTASTGGNGSYKFRGIDDIYNALSALMAKTGLCILPKYSNRQIVERQSAKGNALFYITIDGEFDFISSHDNTKHTINTVGEAMDSGDKGTNKAMSAAYKYACLQAFCIPTEGESVDSEKDDHQVKPRDDKKSDDKQNNNTGNQSKPLTAADKKKKYENYLATIDKVKDKAMYDTLKTYQSGWIEWVKKNYSIEYLAQLERRFETLDKIYEVKSSAPIDLPPADEPLIDDDLPDFMKTNPEENNESKNN